MSKKRTRKDKIAAKHQFTVSWSPSTFEAKSKRSEANVNSQIIGASFKQTASDRKDDSASFSDKTLLTASIRKDIVKSLILAAFILASELVIYLNWTELLSVGFGY